MSIPRFFVPLPLQPGATLALPENVAHHALRVLRLPAGSPIVLFNGEGGAWQAMLSMQGKQAMAELAAFDPRDTELPGRVTLVQGIATGDKMDWIIEKAVELGAHAIAPIAAQRSVLRLSGERLEKRVLHWRRIAQAACEQCGRNRLPVVHAPVTLAQWLADPANAEGLRLMCHPEASDTLSSALSPRPTAACLALLVGPEGGWAEEELQMAGRHDVRRVRFGARVLRTETAGLALLAATGALLGWQD